MKKKNAFTDVPPTVRFWHKGKIRLTEKWSEALIDYTSAKTFRVLYIYVSFISFKRHMSEYVFKTSS